MDSTPNPLRLNRRIYKLPNEILEYIFSHLHGISSLDALVAVDDQVKLLFQARPKATLCKVFDGLGTTQQMQIVLQTILCLRHLADRDLDTGSLGSFLGSHLEGQSFGAIFDAKLDAITLLHEAGQIADQIAQAEESFIKTQLFRGQENFGSSGSNADPSFTELCRIRRALWRLWLYFDIFHSPQSTIHEQNIFEQSSRLEIFIQKLTAWELEELECVYYHLGFQSLLWRKPCLRCGSLFLPDKLLTHTRVCGEVIKELGSLQHFRADHFGLTCGYFRGLLCYQGEARNFAGSDPAADGPNAGWNYVVDHAALLYTEDDFHYRTGSVVQWLDWGYCIWDKNRLQTWRLLHDPARDLTALPESWGVCNGRTNYYEK